MQCRIAPWVASELNTELVLEWVCALFHMPEDSEDLCNTECFCNIGTRISRGLFAVHSAPNGQEFLVRGYRRGGFLSRFVNNTFLRLPWQSFEITRSFAEFNVLERLYCAGVRVPRPAAAVLYLDGSMACIYQAAIVLEYYSEAKNFLELAVNAVNPSAVTLSSGTSGSFDLAKIARLAGEEAAKALSKGVYHSDLHPGNVLVEADERVMLIDFDKATFFKGNFDARDKLFERWKRSCLKHKLPSALAIEFGNGLATFGSGNWL